MQQLTIMTDGGDMVFHISGAGQQPAAFRIQKQKSGIIHSTLTRALNSSSYRAVLEVDDAGKVSYSEALKKGIV